MERGNSLGCGRGRGSELQSCNFLGILPGCLLRHMPVWEASPNSWCCSFASQHQEPRPVCVIVVPQHMWRVKDRRPGPAFRLGREGEKRVPYFEVFVDPTGQYRWRLRGANHEIVAHGEAYRNKSDLKAIEWMRYWVPRAQVRDRAA